MLFSELMSDQKVLTCGGPQNIDVRGIVYDSRLAEPGWLFVAIPGFKTDGHLYITEAVSKGAVALIVQEETPLPPGIAWARVPSAREALAAISAKFHGYPSRGIKVIGVTGTNGKTTTTHLLWEIYRASGQKAGLIGTIANRIGDKVFPVSHTTPESSDLQQFLSLMRYEGVPVAVMEVSSHALSMKRVKECEFDAAVFTNLTQDHLDFHRTMDEYLSVKTSLFSGLGQGVKSSGIAVINADDPHSEHIAGRTRVPVYTYGVEKNANVKASRVKVSAKGVSFRVESPWGVSDLTLQLTGMFNVYNSLAAFTMAAADGLKLDVIGEALHSVPGVSGRFESVDEGQDFAVIVDYAHTPDGLENVLKTARQITKGKLIVVFGCGGDRDRTKRPVMGEIAAKYGDLPIITSDNPRSEDPIKIIRDIEEGILRVLKPKGYIVIPDRAGAIDYAVRKASAGDVVLIAGKGHEDYQIMGLDRLPFDDRRQAKIAIRDRLGESS